jgi:hypothetical protein
MGGRAARHDRPSPLPEHPSTHRVGDQEPSPMTMRRHAADGLFSPVATRSVKPSRVALRASFPGGNGLIAFRLSPVAANEVRALPTVERRIVRKDITRW